MALIRNNWCFLYVCFYKITLVPSLYTDISICLLQDTIAYLTTMGALFNVQKVCEYDQEGNAIDHRPPHDQRQRAEKTEKKTERNTEDRRQQNGSNSLPTSPPHKMIGATIFIINNESTTTEPPLLNNQHH